MKTKQVGNTINPIHALFASMATSIGIGTVVGPSVAVMIGGPAGLFWLLAYIFFGSTIKFVEVFLAVKTRTRTKDGKVVGGPMQYLSQLHPFLGTWYNVLIVLLYIAWTSLQSNTLASVLVLENIPHWVTGAASALFSCIILLGGAKRVGSVASKLVPIMFVLYVSFSFYILLQDPQAVYNAIILVLSSITSTSAAMGGFAGATVFFALKTAVLRGVHMTEAGVGTASIPHAMTEANNPVDQGILAMCSMIADIMLSSLSGLVILVTGVWIKGGFRSTLVYEAFEMHSPFLGKYVLLISLALFVLTTIMGNGFNGLQSFNALTRYRFSRIYIAFMTLVVFLGALTPVPLMWEMADTMMVLVALPNLIGVITLALRYRKELLRIGA
jgi:AGCS family alanine or glycine:cation symporter